MSIVLLSAKYLIILFFALFVFVSFRAQRDVPEENKKSVFGAQKTFLFLVHTLSYACIVIHSFTDELSFEPKQALIFYAGQLFYLIIMTSVIPAVVSLNRGLNNIMCMFLAICMIIQTRLNFFASVRQFWMLLASTVIFLIFVFFCKRTSFLHKLTWLYCITGLALLSAVLILATVTKGAKLSLDFYGFSFQPMEFVKIVFVLFVAAAFNKANTFRTVVITAIFAALHIIILVLCRDLGSALILFAIYVFMLYVATKKGVYLLLGAGAFAAASVIAYKLFSHVRVRISVWMDPWADINDKGYQITQALFAIGTGGWFGAGIFGGSPGYVPEVTNDMVFAAISEEFGGIFALLLIFLCICFVLIIMRVAIRLEYRFYKLLAFGLGIAYIFQVFLNIGGTIKFIPLTGVNLPFVSSGGSSLLSSMVMVGIVQALFVISEADVERERIALANGQDIRQFYDDDAEEYKPRKKKRKEEPVYYEEDGYEEPSYYEEDDYGTPAYEDRLGNYRVVYDYSRPEEDYDAAYDDYDAYSDWDDYDDWGDDGVQENRYYDDEGYYEDPSRVVITRRSHGHLKGIEVSSPKNRRTNIPDVSFKDMDTRPSEKTKVFGPMIFGEETEELTGGYDRYSDEYQARNYKRSPKDLHGGYDRYSDEYRQHKAGRGNQRRK